MSLIFHPQTADQLARMAVQPAHAIGLTGQVGSGLVSTAKFLTDLAPAELVYIYPEKDGKVDRQEGTITVEAIRQLYQLTQGKSRRRRFFALVDADRLSTSAANAFLKLLEEPATQVHFLLLTHHAETLLPTVRSRLQLVTIRPISRDQSQQLLNDLNVSDKTKQAQLLFLAEGRPSLITKLAQDEALFSQEADLLRQARSFVAGSTYQRLVIAESLRRSRTQARQMLDYAMSLMMDSAGRQNQLPSENQRLLVNLEQAQRRLARNGNVRLSLASAAIESQLQI